MIVPISHSKLEFVFPVLAGEFLPLNNKLCGYLRRRAEKEPRTISFLNSVNVGGLKIYVYSVLLRRTLLHKSRARGVQG